jgi:hypothetical protein
MPELGRVVCTTPERQLIARKPAAASAAAVMANSKDFETFRTATQTH